MNWQYVPTDGDGAGGYWADWTDPMHPLTRYDDPNAQGATLEDKLKGIGMPPRNIAQILPVLEQAGGSSVFTDDVLQTIATNQAERAGPFSGNEDPSDILLRMSQVVPQLRPYAQAFQASPAGQQGLAEGQQLWNKSQQGEAFDPALLSFLAAAGGVGLAGGALAGGAAAGGGTAGLEAGLGDLGITGGIGSTAAGLAGGAAGGGLSGAGLADAAGGVGAAAADSAQFGAPGAQVGIPGTSAAAAGAGGTATAQSALSKLLNGTVGADDYLKLLGQVAPGLLGAYGASQQSSALSGLANTYLGLGAPSRSRYEASMTPGFDPMSIPGYSGAVDTASQSLLRQLSASGGNPYGNPGGLIEANKQIINGTALPAIQNYQNQNAAAGGLSALASAVPGIQQQAIGSQGGVLSGIGSSIGNALNPTSSLADLLKQFSATQSPSLA